MLSRHELAGLVEEVGLAEVPLSLAAIGPGMELDHLQGRWADGSTVTARDRFYGASLTKQMTGAAIALLVKRGALNVATPVGRYLPVLPAWRDAVTLRHLLHHTAGLPEVAVVDIGGRHWTTARALAALCDPAMSEPMPGVAELYSNTGYVCLGVVVEQVTGKPLARFIEDEIIGPLVLGDMAIWDSEATPPYPQHLHMGPCLPLTVGDGGLWTAAPAFVGWLDSQNRDRLGIADLVQQPGRLATGALTNYGWGIGLREFRGHPLYIHGGGWPGVAAKAVRCPALGLSVVVFSASDAQDAVGALVSRVLEAIA